MYICICSIIRLYALRFIYEPSASHHQGAPAAAAGKSDGPAARLLIAARTLLLDANVASERGGAGEGWSDAALQAAGWTFLPGNFRARVHRWALSSEKGTTSQVFET